MTSASRFSWLFCVLALLIVPIISCRRGDPRAANTDALVQAMNRGTSLMGQYQYDEAVRAFEQAVQADPQLLDAQVNLAIARFNRAQKDQADTEQATALLDEVLSRQPNHPRALYFKGIILQHIGQAESAVPLFEKVVQLRPDDGVAWYLLGMCRQRAGQSAQTELLKSIELRPYLASAYYRLWQTYQMSGETEKASPFLERFKQLRENPLAETIELPQYNQMGDLALALPLPARPLPPITKSTLSSSTRVAVVLEEVNKPARRPARLPGFSAGDVSGDKVPDLVMAIPTETNPGALHLFVASSVGTYTNATRGSALESAQEILVTALGDFDNDGALDLAAGGQHGTVLFRGLGEGRFEEVTASTGIEKGTGAVHSILFLDADHDGDLDLFLGGPNQLWNNNADGTFKNISSSLGLPGSSAPIVGILPGDLDGDRDADLVLLREGETAIVLVNDLLGQYRMHSHSIAIRGDRGGILQDLSGDGYLDLLVLGGSPPTLQFYRGDGTAALRSDPTFESCSKSAKSWGELKGIRAADFDADGDLDVAVFSDSAHLLLNDGQGHFVLQPRVWGDAAWNECYAADVLDASGDHVPDLLRLQLNHGAQIQLFSTVLTPPSTSIALELTGMRGRDKRTRSPASGYGTVLTARAGLREQRQVLTGVAGGASQSHLPVFLGLGGASQADFVHLLWPDGVGQVEVAISAGQRLQVAELQRKISSCPVLFSWNGTRFECVTDFAGVGGLGYFVGPGDYVTPRAREHIKIESQQLKEKDGFYELRVTEPMEESAYIDRLELVAIDHPDTWEVYPDERLSITGPLPTQELLIASAPIFPATAVGPGGRDALPALLTVDRHYAYEPELDRRFFGFCAPHSLEVDFAHRLAHLRPQDRVFLFLSGYLEYPYSQTTYAASQSQVKWQPIRIERCGSDGRWHTIVPDAGAFGGMARTMTVDLTGLLVGESCRLRLTSNLEIFYDRLFVAHVEQETSVVSRRLTLRDAEARRVGFAREYSPDGRYPLLFDYEHSDPTAPFHILKGHYTRYGYVTELLKDYDDQYAILGPGDEIALRFEAQGLPSLPPGFARSFMLVSHAYCKDMDLYTATPQTLEPLPFRGMTRYPYPASEQYPNTPALQQYQQAYNTRRID